MASNAERVPVSGPAAGDSIAFLLATAGGLAFGLITGVVTARVLGPTDRGVYAVIVLLVGLVAPLGGLGLGDAALYEIRSRRANPSAVAGATVPPVLCSSAAAMCVVAAAVAIAAPGASTALLLAAMAAVIATTASAVVSPVVVAVGGSRWSSLSFFTTSAVTTLVLAVALLADGGVTAAVAAGAIGGSAGTIALLFTAFRRGVRPRLRLDGTYVRRALRYGAPHQLGVVLASLTARVDLLIVYSLLGAGAAGQYSVSLTMAVLAAVAASSVSYGAFPHIASSSTEEALPLVTRTLRAGCTVTLLALLPLVVAAVAGIPVVFGPEYRAAVVPGTVLVLAGAMNGGLFLAARLAAARGRPGVLPLASAVFLVVMLAGDAVLIPRLGIRGAALAALSGAAVGMLVALRALSALVPGAVGLAVLPRTADIIEVLRLPRTAVVSLGRRSGGGR